MPSMKGDIWYFRRTLTGIGPIRRSLRTTDARHAAELEQMILTLASSCSIATGLFARSRLENSPTDCFLCGRLIISSARSRTRSCLKLS